MKKFIITFFAFMMSVASHAEVNWKKVEQELSQQVKSKEFIYKAVAGYGLTGMPRDVMIEHMAEVYKNPEVISMLVREMENAGVENYKSGNASEYGRKFGAELFLSYSLRGLSRLSFEEQRTFMNFLYKWMTVASPVDCKKIMIEGSTSNALSGANIEMKYYNRFKREELEAYFLVIRRALLAEINDFPASRVINSHQSQLADDAFQQEMVKLAKAGELSENVLAAMTDMPRSNPTDVCSAGKFIFKTVSQMKGFTGELMLTKMILSMQ